MKKIWALFKNNYYVVILAATSILSSYYYHSQDLITFYNDTTSHLNIARRIIDNLNPGIVQIGSTWLPLLHLVEIPFIWNDYLWQSGLAGTIALFPAYILLGIFIYKSVLLLTDSKFASLIGVLVMIGNANLLYMQATPMFEPLFIALATGSTYYLLKWIKNETITSLIFAAVFVMLASLTRYEGWFYLLFETTTVLVVSAIKNGRKHAEGRTILFVTLGSLGVFIWFLYNLLVFGSPTYFSQNEYSAFTQQLVYENRGELPTKGNFVFSIANYSLAIYHNLGVLVSLLSGIAFVTVTINLIKKKQYLLLLGILIWFTPFIFHTFSLVHGDTIIIVPELPPYGIEAKGMLEGVKVPFFNIRYGLLMAPAAFVLIGVFFNLNKLTKIITLILVIGQILLFYIDIGSMNIKYNFVALRDIIGSRAHIPSVQKDTQYFKSIYDGGLIIASSAMTDIEIFESGIPLKNYITEGTGDYWHESMVDPSRHARWIMMTETEEDRVGKYVRGTSGFQEFERVYQGGTISLYKYEDNND